MDHPPESNVRVLLIEDNRADVYLIREALKEQVLFFELKVLDDGEKALDFVERLTAASAERPDIVLLDLNLPRCDGKDVLRKLRLIPGREAMPVIVITSSDSPHDREEVSRLGGAWYFRKPSDLDEFMRIGAVVKSLLPARHARAQGG